MGLKSETRDCAGVEVVCTQHPARRAFALFWRLGKVAPYVLGATNDVEAVAELTSRLDVGEADAILSELLSCSAVLVREGATVKQVALTRPEMIDHVFTGNLTALFRAAVFALEVNFRDFTSGAFGPAPDAPATEATVAP